MQVYTYLVNLHLNGLMATIARISGMVAFVIVFLVFPVANAGVWLPLNKDGIHDPRSPAVKQLQQPADALSKLTPDTAGNQVLWIKALEKGEIVPKEKLFSKTEVRKLDRDIILDVNGGMPAVRFPHRQHTEWLDCINCHEHPFKSQTGGTKISMFRILQGEQCGLCHGAVAFPLTECMRCHSIPRESGKPPVIPQGVNPLMHQSGSSQK